MNVPVIAITGTNGKTTTTELLAQMLNACGQRTIACGNIGKPLSEVALEQRELDVLTVEVSSFQLETILRLRSRTPDMSIVKPWSVMPNSLLRRKYDATFALWMMFLLGRQATFGHDPPMYLRSTTATRFPSLANVHAATVDPVPPPRITKS